MTTRCDTTLVVSIEGFYPGKTSPVYAFQRDLGGELHHLNLSTLVPEVDPGNKEWRLQHWGTEDEIDIDYIESDVIVAGEYYLRFLTTETPIVPWVKAVAALYPDLTFHLDYFNVVLGFEGELEIQGDTVLFEEQKAIKVDAENLS
jgi:hypothetical protein